MQDNSLNLLNYSKWKDGTTKLSRNCKEDLSYLKMAYKPKILMLHNSMFNNNSSKSTNNINDDI